MAGTPPQPNNPSTNLPERDMELLSVYLDNELNEHERHTLEQRLQAEPALRAELDTLRTTVTALRDIPPVPLPRSFTLDPATVKPHGFWARFGGLRLAGAAVAIVLLLVVTAIYAVSPLQSPPPPMAFEQRDAGLSADTAAEAETTPTTAPMTAAQREAPAEAAMEAEEAPAEEIMEAKTPTKKPMAAAQAPEREAPAEEQAAAEAPAEAPADEAAGANLEATASTGMVQEGTSGMVPAEPPAPMHVPDAADSDTTAADDSETSATARPQLTRAAAAPTPPPSPTAANERAAPGGDSAALNAITATEGIERAPEATAANGGRGGSLLVAAGLVLILIGLGVGVGVWIYFHNRNKA